MRQTLKTFVPMLIGLMLAACGGSDDGPPTVRTTSYGRVQGTRDGATGTLSWKGIPYAAAPVGAQRWRAPADVAPWSGTLDAGKFGASCIQTGRLGSPGKNNTWDATTPDILGTVVGSEDCLSLNIWRPDTDESGLPVVVFVHGGSFISGYSGDPTIDGANLAKTGNVVVVTLNYRLGVFGFFNSAPLKTGASAVDASGNFAILDLIQALGFLQKIVGEFGGNPSNVTLSGQSAGGGMVMNTMVSPQSAGKSLFHKAFSLSGPLSVFPPNAPGGSGDVGNNVLWRLLIDAGLATDLASAQAYAATQTDAQLAAFLRGRDAAKVLTVIANAGISPFGPIAEGTVVPTDGFAAIASGAYRNVPILMGSTREEGKLFGGLLPFFPPPFGGPAAFKLDNPTMMRLWLSFNPDAPSTALTDILTDPYLPVTTPGTGWNAKTAPLFDLLTNGGFQPTLTALRAKQANVWMYQFDWNREPAPWNDVYGAAHYFDVPFLFGNFGFTQFGNVIGGTANQKGRLALSSAMQQALVAFARNGDPNATGLGLNWPAYPSVLHFDASNTDRQLSVVTP